VAKFTRRFVQQTPSGVVQGAMVTGRGRTRKSHSYRAASWADGCTQAGPATTESPGWIGSAAGIPDTTWTAVACWPAAPGTSGDRAPDGARQLAVRGIASLTDVGVHPQAHFAATPDYHTECGWGSPGRGDHRHFPVIKDDRRRRAVVHLRAVSWAAAPVLWSGLFAVCIHGRWLTNSRSAARTERPRFSPPSTHGFDDLTWRLLMQLTFSGVER